jgi:hypothetical protein
MPPFAFSPSIAGTKSAAINNTGTIRAAVSGGNMARVVNTGTATAFLTFENSGTIVASLTTSMPIVNGAPPEYVAIPSTGTTYVTGITSSGTTTVYITPGTAP